MSSLIQCTDDLLHQKALQSSQYERLEQQLLECERRRRSILLTLQQRVADVTLRGNDVEDLRRENGQLADQLAQHALQLAALQRRCTEARKRQAAAVERLQDGIRSWSGHPARIVLVVQALQAQRQLRTAATKLSRQLQSLQCSLHLRWEANLFAARATSWLRSCFALHAELMEALPEHLTQSSEALTIARRTIEMSTAERVGPLATAMSETHRARLVTQSTHGLLCIYEEAVEDRCEIAKAQVVLLTGSIDEVGNDISAAEADLLTTSEALAGVKIVAAAQRTTFDTVIAAQRDLRHYAAKELRDTVAAESAGETRQRTTRLSLADLQARSLPLLRQVLGIAVTVTLCERESSILALRQAQRKQERMRTEVELGELRVSHEAQLEGRRAARVAVAHTTAREALCALEARGRESAADLQSDEWRLLHAQLVRDACRARAAAAAAANAAAIALKDKRCATAVKERIRGHTTGTSRTTSRKSGHGGRHARTEVAKSSAATAALQRQCTTLDALETLTLTASPHSSVVAATAAFYAREDAMTVDHRATTREPMSETVRSGPLTSSAAHHAHPVQASRLAYRLTSIKPKLVKKLQPAEEAATQCSPAAPGEAVRKKREDARVVRNAGNTSHLGAVARASIISPFTAAVSETSSQSSFSLLQERAAALGDSLSEASAVRLSTPSPSPSPSPRCPTRKRAASLTGSSRPPLRRPPRGDVADAAAVGVVHPLGANASALTAAVVVRTPKRVTLADGPGGRRQQARLAAFSSAFTGNCAALPPTAVVSRRGSRKTPPRSSSPPFLPTAHPPLSSTAAATAATSLRLGRRPPLLPTPATGLGEDIFADLFS